MKNPIEVCCEVGKQLDIPEARAAQIAVESVMYAAWEQIISTVSQDVAQVSQDEPSPAWILLAMATLDRALQRALRPEVKAVFRNAASQLGASPRAATAAEDLIFMLQAPFEDHREEIRALISQRITSAGTLRRGLEDIIPEPRQRIPLIADLWSYRWLWFGRAIRARNQGFTRFRYTNPLDTRTTEFCRWLVERSGRTLGIGKILSQVNAIEKATVENDVEALKKAQPMLTFNRLETEKDLARIYVENELAMPPFHWRCRTGIEPV